MKNQFKLIVAALLATAMATPAFALTVDTKGYFNIRGQADRNLNDGSDRGTADNDRTAVEQRMRLWTEAAADENIKGVFALESDIGWGTADGDIGVDTKGNLEVKQVYLDFKLPSLDTNVKAGAQGFSIGRGFIANDDALGVQTATKLGDVGTLKLYWVKAIEGSVEVTSDDVDFYGAQVDVKAGDLTIAPVVAWTREGKNTDIYFGGASVDGKLGDNLKIAATVIKNWGDNSAGENVDGLAAYLGVFTKAGDMDLSVEGAWMGDDGRTNGEFVDGSGGNINSWGFNSPTEMLGGARYDRRAIIGKGIGAANATGAGDLYYLNKAYVKVGFGMKTSEKTKLSGYIAHIQAATGANDGLSSAYGEEIGAYYDITLAKGLSYNLMAAYLINDDFGGVGNDNVYKLGNSLLYSF